MTKKMLKLGLAIFSFATIIVVKPMNVKAETSDDYKIQAKETVTEFRSRELLPESIKATVPI